MEVRGWSKSKEGPAGTPNTDSPLARGGQVGHSSNTEQPEKEEDGDKQEEGILPAGGRVTLSQIHTCSPPERIMGIEHGGEKAKGESTNTKREVKAPGVTEWLEPPSALWSRSLALRAGWSFQPGVLGLLAPSPIERDDLLPADASFTHWALLALWPRLQPLMKTGPTGWKEAKTGQTTERATDPRKQKPTPPDSQVLPTVFYASTTSGTLADLTFPTSLIFNS